MTILWQKTIDAHHYEIRSAGRTRRLYTNGVCHSEFNPRQVFTGSIWDLLILPVWFYPADTIHRVLVLGVGGGTIPLQLEMLLGPVRILGIERDPVHIHLARKFFDIESSRCKVVEADAGEWLKDYNGEPFDMIIDDLFIDSSDDAVRAVEVDEEWSELLVRHLKKEGLITINFGSREELTRSAICSRARFHRYFPSVFQMTTPMLDNYVGVFVGREVNSGQLRDALRRHPVAERALSNRRIRYRIRQLM